jgi:uncharacterized protein (DUF2252 family)
MSFRRPFYTFAVSLLGVCVGMGCDRKTNTAGGGATSQGTGAAAAALPTGNGPFDILARTYKPYTTATDDLGFPMKVRNLSSNPYRFWRGSKELFYEWCKTHTREWIADQGAYLRIHGDLHPGNMGLYHSEGKFGRHVAFGAVDFDDSARLPFQLELLEGTITFELLAKRRALKLDKLQVDQVITEILGAYRAALDSDQTPTQLLEEDRWVGKMLKDARKHDYADELKKYIHKDQFVGVVKDKDGNAKEILRPVKGRSEFAQTITEALTNTPDAHDLFKDADIRKKDVEDMVRRTQLESAGSEGLHKYLILLTNKKSPEGVLILYLKQQIPTSAERVGLIPRDPRPPGQRSSDDMDHLSRPNAYFNTWCTWNEGSYRLSIKEPWSETMDAADVDTMEDLKHLARIWGTVAGSAHRQGPEVVARIKARLTPALSRQLRELGMTYAKKVVEDSRQFDADPRARALITKAEAALNDLKSKARD